MALSISQIARMDQLLDQALELDEQGRRRWLQALGPEHQDLADVLHRALLPDWGAPDAQRLDTRPKLDLGDVAKTASTLAPGDRVGPYQLVRALGAGGMAEVWLAQRADGAFKREVALKLPFRSWMRRELEKRFARERDILASLEHPNIARLYDGGVTEESLPYLAMEYVPGEPLTAWCDLHQQGIRERIKLFLQVLDAVQYAHARHVIHRDIKPSNILVTESGQVRLLDFGVAKLLADEDAEQTQLTQIYGRALTPDYASPEYLLGQPADIANDIYSLGVVLYELLAGSRPYHLKAGSSQLMLEKAITEVDVQRPSMHLSEQAATARATTQVKLARGLHGDLDAIVLKALARSPQQRYSSAEALADDLQRYLSGEPVHAQPDRLIYRMGKFALRHRTGLSMSAAATLAVIGTALFVQSRTPPPTPAGTGGVPASAAEKSIAVLPFTDMSEKHDQEYFSDGLTEELIDRLTHTKELKVIARTSSFYFKGKQATVGDIASALHVSHLLEGSVRKSGDALRITAQLIKAADGSHLWSQTYDRKVNNIFEVQEEIAATVAKALNVALDQRLQGKDREPNVEAHNLLLQGDFFLHRYSKQDTQRAIKLFSDAIRADPGYALPWAKLGVANVALMDNSWISTQEGMPKAKQAIQRALEIDPDLAYAHDVLGKLLFNYEWNFSQAQVEWDRAREQDPNNLDVAIHRCFLKEARSGRVEERIDLLRQKLLRNPLDTDSQRSLAVALVYADRIEEAAAELRREMELNPSEAGDHAMLGHWLMRLGRNDEALAEVQKETDETWKLSELPFIYWALGRRVDSNTAMRRYEKQYGDVDAYAIADAHAYRGETDAAFQWLGRAFRQRDANILWIKADWYLRDLRKDSRYQTLLVKLKLDGAAP
jgi:serine/threonine protein kinase